MVIVSGARIEEHGRRGDDENKPRRGLRRRANREAGGRCTCQFLSEIRETVRDQNQPPGALSLERPDAPLDDGQASVLPNCPESVKDSAPPTPPPELLGSELNPLVGDEMPGPLTDLSENSL